MLYIFFSMCVQYIKRSVCYLILSQSPDAPVNEAHADSDGCGSTSSRPPAPWLPTPARGGGTADLYAVAFCGVPPSLLERSLLERRVPTSEARRPTRRFPILDSAPPPLLAPAFLGGAFGGGGGGVAAAAAAVALRARLMKLSSSCGVKMRLRWPRSSLT